QQSISVSWTVANLGTSAAQPSWADRLYLSADQTCCTTDALLGSVVHATHILPGGTYGQTKTVTIPAKPAGSYYLILAVDPNDAVYESSESNNLRAVPFTVAGASVGTLAITSVNGGLHALAGQPFTVRVEARDTNGIAMNVTKPTALLLSLRSGAGGLGGTITGTIPLGASQATISAVTYSKPENGAVPRPTRTRGD